MQTDYLKSSRNKMNQAIEEFFEADLKKEFKQDFILIEPKLKKLINRYTRREILMILRQEVKNLKSSAVSEESATIDEHLDSPSRDSESVHCDLTPEET